MRRRRVLGGEGGYHGGQEERKEGEEEDEEGKEEEVGERRDERQIDVREGTTLDGGEREEVKGKASCIEHTPSNATTRPMKQRRSL